MKGLLAFTLVFLVAACAAGSFGRSDDLENEVCYEDGGLVPHPDCSKYYVCDNGQLVVQACSVGTIFNPREGICDFPANVPECVGGTRPPETTATTSTTTTSPNTTRTTTTTTTTTEAPPTTPEEIVTTEEPTTTTSTTRRTTTTTRNTTTTTTTTEAPEITTEQEVDPTTEYVTNATSTTTNRPTSNTTRTTTTEEVPVTTEPSEVTDTTASNRICNGNGTYTLPVAGNCSLYILCVNGQDIQQKCPPGLFYDPKLGTCNFADEVEECNAPLCAEDEIGYKPVGGNCTSFILCADGEATIGTCPAGTLFDPVYLQCNRADLVDCEDGSAGNNTISHGYQSKKEQQAGLPSFFSRIFG